MRYLAENTGQQLRRAAIELLIGMMLLGAVVYGFHASRKVSAAPKADRNTLVAQLRQNIDRAVANSNMTDEQRTRLAEARKVIRESEAAKRKGHAVDQARRREAVETLRQLLASEAFRPEDRKAVDRSLEALGDFQRTEQARRRQLRRDSLVQQLGFPLGLLADFAVESL